MKSYPLYKKTGLSWIDEVPQEWKKVAIKFLASDKNSIFIDGDWIESKDITDSDDIRYITTGNVGVGRYIEKGNSFISEETFAKLRCKDVEPGDILISRLNLPIGRSCIAPNLGRRVVTSVDNVILRSDDGYDRRFLVYLFSDPDYLNNAENLARGTTMQRISRTQLGNIRVFVPEGLKEQKSIADFLDRRLAPLDKLIFEKQNFINLLKEKRQALISHVVTKGLDPNVEMKDSGVEWIGDIPVHWVCKKLKWEVSAKSGTDEKHEEGVFDLYGANGVIGSTDTVSVLNDSGVVIIGRVGSAGAVTYVQKKSGISDNALIINNYKFDLPRFDYYLFLTTDLDELVSKNAQPLITASNIKDIKICAPDTIEERLKIATFLDHETAKIDNLVKETGQSIQLLKERRTALISAAVTGKIDLRDKEVA